MLIKLYEDDLSIKMADVLDLFELFMPEDCELTRKEIENNMRKSLNARDPAVFHKDVIVIIDFVCKMDSSTFRSLNTKEKRTQIKFKNCFNNCYFDKNFNLGLWDCLFGSWSGES
jgi:hypothetical protein